MRRCAVEGCGRDAYSRELCEPHYRRALRTGDPAAAVRIGRDRRPSAPCPTATARPRPGWCHGHYLRWLRTGDIQADIPLEPRVRPTCSLEGCEREHKSRGFCAVHYKRTLVHGHAREDVPVRVATGEGWITHGYRGVTVPPELRHLTNGETEVGEHRLAMAQYLGRALHPDEVVHHRNGITTDNRIENLELWSTAHVKGQRDEDKVAHAVEMLRRYRPDLLKETDTAPGGDVRSA